MAVSSWSVLSIYLKPFVRFAVVAVDTYIIATVHKLSGTDDGHNV